MLQILSDALYFKFISNSSKSNQSETISFNLSTISRKKINPLTYHTILKILTIEIVQVQIQHGLNHAGIILNCNLQNASSRSSLDIPSINSIGRISHYHHSILNCKCSHSIGCKIVNSREIPSD